MKHDISDTDLLARLNDLALSGRRTTAELIALLAEVEDRGLHLAAGHSSLFAYCRTALRFSEGEAGNRVAPARAARRFPLVLDLLRSGALNLTSVRLLAPHLTEDNHAAVLDSARGLDRAGIERLVVALAPKPIPTPTLRVVPAPAPAAPRPVPATPPRSPAAVTPLTPEVYRLTATMSAETRELWQRLRELVVGDDATVLARVVAAALPVLDSAGMQRRRRSGRRGQRPSIRATCRRRSSARWPQGTASVVRSSAPTAAARSDHGSSSTTGAPG